MNFLKVKKKQKKLDLAPSIDNNSQNEQYSNVAGRFLINYKPNKEYGSNQ